MWLLPAVLLLTGLLYHGTLSNGFVWDDSILFVDNASLRSGVIDWAVLSQPVMDGTTYLRPLVLASWAAEFRLWGVNATAAHAVNLALHLLNVALVYVLALMLLRPLACPSPVWRAGLAALIYGLHPCLLEATAWISGRFDLMATTFMLLALIADGVIAGRWSRAAGIAFSFALALGSKEVAVMLPPLLLCLRLVREPAPELPLWRAVLRIAQRDFPTVLALGLVFALWVMLRLSAFGAVVHSASPFVGQPSGAALYLHPLLVLNALQFYLAEIVVPFTTLGPLHPFIVEDLASGPGVLRASGALLALAGLAWLLWKRSPVGFLIACVLLALLPVLQIVPLSSTARSIGSDRFLTLPLVFIALSLAAMPFPLTQQVSLRVQKLGTGLLLGAWIFLSAATITVTVPLWRSDLSLWAWSYQKFPDLQFAQSAYLHALSNAKRLDEAAVVFERLRAKGPLHSFVQIQYGAYLASAGQLDEAENYLRGALRAYAVDADGNRRDPHHVSPRDGDRPILAHAYQALSQIHNSRGDFEEALRDIDIALNYKPGVPVFGAAKALMLLATNQVEAGEALYTQSMSQLMPEQRLVVANSRIRFLARLCTQHNEPRKVICEGYEPPPPIPH
ncbi:hypothetical protein DFR24_2726 [Panacagrimonas perspica]|uniref:Uncharacterized protein n=1 Tax=Panacagrimonas perspica TaxID=381431 RepID=A0A4R7P3V9_9GAMM|nr:hypothetical protein [Panacagrimonas perspica]TDU28357.1 hypothetical protein DFR24_2726 [Panacagrimonas perspica]